MFKLKPLPEQVSFCQALRFETLEQLYPREEVSELLSKWKRWGQRERCLNQLVIVYYVIALSLFRQLNIAAVFRQLAHGLRWLWPDPWLRLPSAAALVYRRKHLGTPVMRHLFQQVCRPMATEHTKGAFQFGLRLMAVDSTLEEVADTKANELSFGRMSRGHGRSPFPQVRCFYLAEAGTHAIVDALFAPCRISEQRLAPVLIRRSIQPGMFVLMDRGLTSASFISLVVKQQKAHVLGRLKINQYTKPEHILADGSYLLTLHPQGLPAVQVRVIEYQIEPRHADRLAEFPWSLTSDRPNPKQRHRLVTSLLDPNLASALQLILCYHERWEIEGCIGEQKTHLRLSHLPMRSKSPALVCQELYGLLLAHYLIRWWMHQSACQGDFDPDRLSFTHAVQVLRIACSEWTLLPPQELLRFQQRLLCDLRDPATILPVRRPRFYPRVIKRSYSMFYRKKPCYRGFTLKPRSFIDILLI
jgi:hypothetical protein